MITGSKEKIAKLLRIAGNENRIKILCAVFEGEDLCVSELAKKLGGSMAVTSHHLQVMAKAGILKSVRHGKRICYVLPKTPIVSDLKGLICKYK